MILLLHRIYRTQSGLRFFLSRRVSSMGVGLLITLIVACLMMFGNPMRSLYQIVSLLLGVVIVAGIWVFFRKGHVQVMRVIPRHAIAGEVLPYEVMAENKGADLPSVKLREKMPDPRPEWEAFRNAREPGEQYRNFFDRSLAFYRWQWLVEQGMQFTAEDSAFFSLRKGEKGRVAMTLTPRKRGMILLDEPQLLLPEPLGLFQRVKPANGHRSKLIVLPKCYPVSNLRLPGMPSYQVGDDSTSRQLGQGGEFASLREYRSGDPPKYIHWASWAKTGRPIVKELEETIFSRYALVLDTFGDAASELLFEDAVSVAASFARALDTSECMIDLMFLGDRDHVVSAGRGLAPALVLLEALASVQMGYEERFEALAKLVVRHASTITGCLCIFHGWSESRERFFRKLQAAGIQCHGFAVVASDGDLTSSNGLVQLIQRGKIAEGLLTLK